MKVQKKDILYKNIYDHIEMNSLIIGFTSLAFAFFVCLFWLRIGINIATKTPAVKSVLKPIAHPFL